MDEAAAAQCIVNYFRALAHVRAQVHHSHLQNFEAPLHLYDAPPDSWYELLEPPPQPDDVEILHPNWALSHICGYQASREIDARDSDPNYLQYAFSSRLAEPEMPALPDDVDFEAVWMDPRLCTLRRHPDCEAHRRRFREYYYGAAAQRLHIESAPELFIGIVPELSHALQAAREAASGDLWCTP